MNWTDPCLNHISRLGYTNAKVTCSFAWSVWSSSHDVAALLPCKPRSVQRCDLNHCKCKASFMETLAWNQLMAYSCEPSNFFNSLQQRVDGFKSEVNEIEQKRCCPETNTMVLNQTRSRWDRSSQTGWTQEDTRYLLSFKPEFNIHSHFVTVE